MEKTNSAKTKLILKASLAVMIMVVSLLLPIEDVAFANTERSPHPYFTSAEEELYHFALEGWALSMVIVRTLGEAMDAQDMITMAYVGSQLSVFLDDVPSNPPSQRFATAHRHLERARAQANAASVYFMLSVQGDLYAPVAAMQAFMTANNYLWDSFEAIADIGEATDESIDIVIAVLEFVAGGMDNPPEIPRRTTLPPQVVGDVSIMPDVALAEDVIRVTVDGQEVNFPGGQGPVIVEERTLVPVRGVFEAIGFEVDWDDDARAATLTRADFTVIVTLDSNVFTTNGASHNLEVPAQLIGGRTLLPIGAVLESVGYEVDWDAATRTVVIESPVTETPLTILPVIYVPAQMLSATPGQEILNFVSAYDRVDEIRALADSGDALGQYLYGLMNQGGGWGGMAADIHRAIELYRLSAEQGFPRSIAQLGVNYRLGVGVEQNLEQAVYLLRMASEMGNAFGQNHLGNMYLIGDGVPQDYVQAVYWTRLSAEGGNAASQNNIGFRYYLGQGVTQSYDRAAYWYRIAAENGSPVGQSNLGYMYQRGLGVPQDYEQAAYWFRQAAYQGNLWGGYRLGLLYRDGNGVEQDYVAALHWLNWAAGGGHENAQAALDEFGPIPIRMILGVDYTISPVEITRELWGHMEGEMVRWQAVELYQPLDITRFPSAGQWPLTEDFGGLFPTQTGDVLIATHPDGRQLLHIDIGWFTGHSGYWQEDVHRQYFIIEVDVELSPQETMTLYEFLSQ